MSFYKCVWNVYSTIHRVPLDWNDKSKGDIPLSLIRLAAKTTPREGYMFYNPGIFDDPCFQASNRFIGGPGIPGTNLLSVFGEELQAQLGAGWDIVSWDTRRSLLHRYPPPNHTLGGLLKSGPNITAFDNDQDYSAYVGQYQGLNSVSARGNLTQSADVDFL